MASHGCTMVLFLSTGLLEDVEQELAAGGLCPRHPGGHRLQGYLAGAAGVPLHRLHPGQDRPGEPGHQDGADYNRSFPGG